MKKIKFILLFAFVVNNLVVFAQDFDKLIPTGSITPDAYKATTGSSNDWKSEYFCAWENESEWEIRNTISSENVLATKVLAYYNGKWNLLSGRETDTKVDYITKCEADNDQYINSITFKSPLGEKNYDTVYFVFVNFKADLNNDNNNKIKNPHFNTLWDASSDYKRGEGITQGDYLNAGEWSISNHMKWRNFGTKECEGDRTSSDGNFFAANGALTNVPLRVWYQENIDVGNCASNYLAFRVYVQQSTDPPYAQLQWYIQYDGNQESNLGDKFEVNGERCAWIAHTVIYKKADGFPSNVTLALKNMLTGEQNGNDFGLDDLYFGCVNVEYSFHRWYIGQNVKVTSMELCAQQVERDYDKIKAYLAEKENVKPENGKTLTLAPPETENETIKEEFKDGTRSELIFDVENTKKCPEPWNEKKCKYVEKRIRVTYTTANTDKEWRRTIVTP